ncbi:MAG: hypothetical protein KKG64_03855 [Firmicutes bacterium]|nr:hypothetical protein [Bacillota bacterium]
MNKRGVSLIELLAGFVIFALAVSLAATVISLLNYASDRIEINSLANREGLFLDREIKDDILAFGPTTYSTCGGQDCIILEKEFTYEFDPILEDILLTTYSPALTHKIEISKGEILIDDVALVIDNFTLGSNSNIDIIENLNQAYLVITIELIAANGKIFTFTTSYSFAILDIPAS